MYAPTYGFGQGGNNAQQQAGFNPNAPSAALPVTQYFQGQQPQPQPQQQQQQQQMMYNSQQYGGAGAGAGAGPQQNPYAAMGVNPALMQGNGGMAHMAANNGVGTLHRTSRTCSTT
jgi:hypothetical protein